MRLPIVIATLAILPVLVFADNPPKPDAPAKPVTAAEASKMIGKKVTIEMEVNSVGKSGSVAFLNSEADYKNKDNFTVFLPKETIQKLKEAKIDDLSAHFKGKTIQVTGTVILYHEKPEIKVDDPVQLSIVERK